MPSELLTVTEAARWAKMSASALNKMRMAGATGGPRWVKLGQCVRYRLEDLEAWARANVVGEDPEPEARP